MELLELRKINKLNQKEMAEILGISQGTYSKYESGTLILNKNQLLILSKHFRKSIDEICDNETLFNKEQLGYIPEYRIETIKKLLSLNERQFDKANAYIEALIDATVEIRKELKGI